MAKQAERTVATSDGTRVAMPYRRKVRFRSAAGLLLLLVLPIHFTPAAASPPPHTPPSPLTPHPPHSHSSLTPHPSPSPLPSQSSALNLNSVRESYRLACEDWERESVCAGFERKAVELVRTNGGDPVARGFRATAGLMMCQFVSMPWDQYRGFVKWRDELDASIVAAPGSADLRLLRFGVAKNVPAFLGYRAHVAADRAAVEAALRKGVWAGSPAFENFVRATLKAK